MKVWTDGSCNPNPGPGGWGFVIPSLQVSHYGHCKATTNNAMELTAAIRALQYFEEGSKVHVHSDSAYVVNGIRSWVAGWKKRGWRTQKGPVANEELWKQLDSLSQARRVSWTWVKGHSTDKHNQQADRLAEKGRLGKKTKWAAQIESEAPQLTPDFVFSTIDWLKQHQPASAKALSKDLALFCNLKGNN